MLSARAIARLAPTVLLGVWLTGCAAPKHALPTPATNVVMIVIDTLRADHLGCYGHQRATSPNIDRLAANGVRFTNAYATSPWTYPSMASIVTGLYPEAHGAYLHGAVRNQTWKEFNASLLSERYTTLPEILTRHGVTSGMIAANPYLAYGVEQGFDEAAVTVHAAEAQTQQGLDWVQGLETDQRFFLLLHYMDVHTPNRPPEAHRALFPEISELRFDKRRLYANFQPHHGRPEGWSDPDFDEYRRGRLAMYDASIHYVDEQIGRLVASIRQARPEQETVFIVTADHGEEFWDHAWVGRRLYEDPRNMHGCGHGHTLFEEVVKIPLVVIWDGTVPPRLVDIPVSLVDLLPTVLELMHVPFDGIVQGRSLLDALLGESFDTRPVHFDQACFGRNKTGVVDGDLKWIQPDGEPPLLFDLARDPGERHDLSGSEPAERERLEQMISRMREQSLILGDAIREGEDPTRAPELTPEELERLKALGYVQ